MKHHAVDTREAPQQIISSCVEGLSKAAAAQIPELNTVQWVVYHQHQQADNPLHLPVDLAALEVPDIYHMTFTSEQFHQVDLGGQAHLLLFVSPIICHLGAWLG